MAKKFSGEKKRLAAYWGEDALYFVETSGTNPLQIFSVPFTERNTDLPDQGGIVPWNIQLISLIQDALRRQNISQATVYLALPVKDIIFRSFVIPWMQPNEIKGVVDFEVRRYIPFPLEELYYCFHSILLKENNARKIRIIFAAVKKISLEYYLRIFEQVGARIGVMEPAAVSVLRPLIFKKLISSNQSLIIIEKGEATGKIILVNQGIPQFVREFHLSSPAALSQDKTEPKNLISRFVNEVRISMEYFNRQDRQLELKQLMLITQSPERETAQALQESLRLPVTAVDNQAIFGQLNPQNTGFISAYGVGLLPSVPISSNVSFDLTREKMTVSGQPSRPRSADVKSHLKSVVLAGCLCLLIIGLFYFYLQKKLDQQKNELTSVTNSLESFDKLSLEELKAKRDQLKNKLTAFQNIRTKSQVSLFLVTVPSLLPKGTWLKTLDIKYSEKNNSNLALNISGYAYVEDTRGQFELINRLLSNFKQNKIFDQFFDNIDLKNVKAQRLNDFPVTYFEINSQ